MITKAKNYPVIAGVIALALLVMAIASFWYASAFSRSVSPSRSFSVNGEGRAIAIPDVAELSFGVIAEGGKNLTDLQKENTDKVNRVIAFLKRNGVEDKDIKTQSYNITPRYQYFSCPPPPSSGGKREATPCPPPEIAGYSISQTVLVKIRALAKAGDIVAGVVEQGANTVSGPNFTVDDPAEFQQKAREEAMRKAKEKAVATAASAGFRLGRLVSVNEGVALAQPFPAERFAFGGKGGDFGGAPEIEAGSREIRINISLTYEIK